MSEAKNEQVSAGGEGSMSFEVFWGWVQAHANCILRAGTPETLLFDDDDFHWHFASGGEDLVAVQTIRGKRLVGEMLIRPSDIAWVRTAAGEVENEYFFELLGSDDREEPLYHFVLAHPVEEEEATAAPAGRWTH